MSERFDLGTGIAIGAGTIFRLGKQKLVKNNQDNQIQSITLCNMYLLKKVYAEAGGIFENFSVKSNLKVTFNCKLQKKIGGGGAGCTSCSPNNFVGGATVPVPAPIGIASYGALGHVPLRLPFNFSGHFRAAQSLTFDSMWLPTQNKYSGL